MIVMAVASVLRMNRRLFLNCLDGISEQEANRRPSDATNSLSFIACHLVDSRHFLASFLSLEIENPFGALLANVQRIEDAPELPGLHAIRHAWNSVASAVDACVADLHDDELSAPSPQRFPVDDPTLGGGLMFLVQHESYHIGQMAIIRKYLGHPAMSYR